MFESASISRLRVCFKVLFVEGMIATAIGAFFLIQWCMSEDGEIKNMNLEAGADWGMSGLLILLLSFIGCQSLNSNQSAVILRTAILFGILTCVAVYRGVTELVSEIETFNAPDSQELGYFSLILTFLIVLTMVIIHGYTGYACFKVFKEIKNGGPSADRLARLEENDVY